MMWLFGSTRLVMLKKNVTVRGEWQSVELYDFVDEDGSVYNIVSGIPDGQFVDVPADYYAINQGGEEDDDG